jgi:hypothetical protein
MTDIVQHSSWRRIFGVVAARNGPAQGDPAGITYTIVGLWEVPSGRRVKVVFNNAVPTRRISQGAQIIAANIGAPCDTTIGPSGTHHEIKEGIPFVEACGQDSDFASIVARAISQMTPTQRQNIREILA